MPAVLICSKFRSYAWKRAADGSCPKLGTPYTDPQYYDLSIQGRPTRYPDSGKSPQHFARSFATTMVCHQRQSRMPKGLLGTSLASVEAVNAAG